MKSVKQFLIVSCAITAVAAGAYAADSASSAGNVAGDSEQWHGPHHRGHGGHGPFLGALHQLNLTAAQQQSIHSLFDAAKPQMQSLHQQMRSNGEALQSTAPDAPNYPSLIATEKQLATQGVQQRADLHAQIYAVLTPQQKAQLPQVLADLKAKREQRIQQRKNHAPPDSDE